jgi:hypothetical protein
MLDVAYNKPDQWSDDFKDDKNCFLNEDYCNIRDEEFYVRGVIPIPIIGTDQFFMYGVWGSVSKKSFDLVLNADEDPKRDEIPRLFSWLCNSVAGYPDSQSLKMDVVVQEIGARPHFELHRSDHPLAQEFHNGITPKRAKDIMKKWVKELN